MFEHVSSRAFFVGHGSLGLVLFACVLVYKLEQASDPADPSEWSRSLTETNRFNLPIPSLREASRISLIGSVGWFFCMAIWLMSEQVDTNLSVIQRSILSKRLDFCLTLSLYITFFSSLFNAMQLIPEGDVQIDGVNGETVLLDIARPIEWMLTCPLMQLAVPILGGERVPDSRRMTMPACSFMILCFGVAASFSRTLISRVFLFNCGFLGFLLLCHLMNLCVSEATEGENVFHGRAPIRYLVLIIIITWVPFPVWYALSPEGFGFVEDQIAMKIAVAFLNVFAKSTFMIYVGQVRHEHRRLEKTLRAVGYDSSGDPLEEFSQLGLPSACDMDKNTRQVIKEVLDSMGRPKEFKEVLQRFQANDIMTSDDVLVMTPQLCKEVRVPWEFVRACQSKIRADKHIMGEMWSTQKGALFKDDEPPSAKLRRDSLTRSLTRSSTTPLPALSRAPQSAVDTGSTTEGPDEDNISVDGFRTPKTVAKEAHHAYSNVDSPREKAPLRSDASDTTAATTPVPAPVISNELQQTRDELKAVLSMLSSLKNAPPAEVRPERVLDYPTFSQIDGSYSPAPSSTPPFYAASPLSQQVTPVVSIGNAAISSELQETRDELKAVVAMLSSMKEANQAHVSALEQKVDSQHNQIVSDLHKVTEAHAQALEKKVDSRQDQILSHLSEQNQARIESIEKQVEMQKNETKQSFTTLFRKNSGS
jgi:bacteriorhodopsin